VSDEIVELAEERMALWSELREMSGDVLAPGVRQKVISELEREYEQREAELRAEYEARLAEQETRRASAAATRIVDTLLQEIGR
jgi:rRNA-processing protein FCF1